MTATCICITREDIGPGVPRAYADWTAQQWRDDCPTHGRYTLLHGDCREVLATFDENSIDAIVTDPPYDLTNRTPDVKQCRDCGRVLGGADGKPDACPRCGGVLENQRSQAGRGFMGKQWDGTGVAFDVATWEAAYRVLKPGAHLVAFGAPRTYHRMACAIEDAGFEIRDCLQWLFGSGFPKSLNLHGEWEGWGTALKPAYEPIVLARKPLTGTVAGNVAQWGTGGLNIDATRIGTEVRTYRGMSNSGRGTGVFRDDNWQARDVEITASGRWPANVLLDDEAARLLDAMSGATVSRQGEPRTGINGEGWGLTATGAEYNDRGGASRYFYTAKTSRAEREFGLDDLEPTRRSDGSEKDIENPRLRTNERRNDHPTVKPVDLMRWLCRLITPPGGIVLDPFLGSGSTGMAALDEGFRFVGIDLEPHYIEIARRRIARRHAIEPLPQRDEGQGVLL